MMEKSTGPRLIIQMDAAQWVGTREEQQDYVNSSRPELQDELGVLCVLADGMGGLTGGREAAKAVGDTMVGIFHSSSAVEAPEQILLRGCYFSQQEVLRQQQAPNDRGATLIAVLVRDLHIANTLWAVIIPYTAFNLSFSTMVIYGYMRSLPFELEESACLDGASIWTCFLHIIVPNVKSAIATVAIFVFMAVWNEYNLALVLLTRPNLKTLPLGLLFFQGEYTTDWGAMGATMVIASIPTVLIYTLFSAQVEKAMTVSGAVKG